MIFRLPSMESVDIGSQNQVVVVVVDDDMKRALLLSMEGGSAFGAGQRQKRPGWRQI
jgi:hypothetical protein